MKKILVIAVLVCLPVVLMAQTHQKFTQSGKFASISEPIGSTGNFSLSATLNTDSGGTTATIDFSEINFTPDFSSLTIVTITGNMPPTDLTGTATKTITLNFSTADLNPSTSFTSNCVISFITFQETCSPLPAGTISLTFNETDAFETDTSLSQDIIMGNITKRIHSKQDTATASASGTVLGITVSGGAASVGQNHRSTVEVIHP